MSDSEYDLYLDEKINGYQKKLLQMKKDHQNPITIEMIKKTSLLHILPKIESKEDPGESEVEADKENQVVEQKLNGEAEGEDVAEENQDLEQDSAEGEEQEEQSEEGNEEQMATEDQESAIEDRKVEDSTEMLESYDDKNFELIASHPTEETYTNLKYIHLEFKNITDIE